jgi:hypothetical protein
MLAPAVLVCGARPAAAEALLRPKRCVAAHDQILQKNMQFAWFLVVVT